VAVRLPAVYFVCRGLSSGSADLWLLYTPDGQNYPGGTENHDPVKFNVEYNTEVVVDKVVEEGTTDEGPLYPGCPGTSVYLEAKPNPSYASFPAGEPHWTVQGPFGTCPYFSEDTGPTTRLFPGYKWGDYIVTAKCGSNDPGDSITVKFNLVNEIPWGIYTPTWGTTQYCSARDLLCDKTS
jgi:hypothetical protein